MDHVVNEPVIVPAQLPAAQSSGGAAADVVTMNLIKEAAEAAGKTAANEAKDAIESAMQAA